MVEVKLEGRKVWFPLSITLPLFLLVCFPSGSWRERERENTKKRERRRVRERESVELNTVKTRTLLLLGDPPAHRMATSSHYTHLLFRLCPKNIQSNAHCFVFAQPPSTGLTKVWKGSPLLPPPLPPALLLIMPTLGLIMRLTRLCLHATRCDNWALGACWAPLVMICYECVKWPVWRCSRCSCIRLFNLCLWASSLLAGRISSRFPAHTQGKALWHSQEIFAVGFPTCEAKEQDKALKTTQIQPEENNTVCSSNTSVIRLDIDLRV